MIGARKQREDRLNGVLVSCFLLILGAHALLTNIFQELCGLPVPIPLVEADTSSAAKQQQCSSWQ